MKQIIISIIFIISINIYCDDVLLKDFSEASKNKNDMRNSEKDIYFFKLYFNDTYYFIDFNIEDFIDSIYKLDSMVLFDKKNKVFKAYDYFNIDERKDYDYSMIFWNKFFNKIYHDNFFRMDSIVNFFNLQNEKNNWTDLEFLKKIVSSIQNLNYIRPYQFITDWLRGDSFFDFFTPNGVAFYESGDCDTKSIFLLIILKRLGFDAVLIHSPDYLHVMVGVNIDAEGKYLEYNSKKYYFIEVTEKNYDIGKIYIRMDDMDKWYVISME